MNFNLIRNTFLSLSLLLTQVNGFSQSATISASPSSVSVNGCSSPSVAFSGSFSATTTATAFTFDGGVLPAGWSSSPYTVSSSTCPGQNTPDNTAYFWATDLDGSGKRFVQTSAVDVTYGGSIDFLMRYGNGEAAACEQPDLPDEEVWLQYSTNGGGSWTTIFNGWDTSPSGSFAWYNWDQQSVAIPAGAQTASTIFRWYQPSNSGTCCDNWGLENVSISAIVPITINTWSWNFGDGSPAVSGQNVNHTFPNIQGNNTYTVTLTATADTGTVYTTTSNYSVSIVDGIAPTITSCPGNVVVTADPTNCAASVVTYATPTATDACSAVTITRTSGLASGSSFPVGPTTVVHRASDAAGNTATCGFTVTVNDVTAPSFFSNAGFTTPYSMSNQTVGTSTGSATPGFCDGFLTWQHPYAFDNCGFGTLSYAISGATVVGSTAFVSGASITQAFNEGVSTFTYTLTDAAGNAATYSFTVTVEDDVNPVISATNQTFNYSLAGSACTELVTFSRPDSTALTGDCNPVTMSQSVVSGPDLALMNPHPINPATGGGSVTALFPAGTTVIRYSWLDSDGNSTSVDYSFVVTDSQVPTAACNNITVVLGASSPGTYTLNPNDINNGSVDNCPLGSTLTVNPSVYTCANIGTSNYVLTITDASGNTATATCQITVQDTTTPVVVCPASVTVGTNVSCTASVTMNPISASDNCSNPMLSATWVVTGATTISGTGLSASGTFNLGASVITYTATYGTTSATCSATVTVQDDDAPTPIACPSNITVTGNIAPGCSFKLGTPPAGWTWNGQISFSDNCGANFTPAGQPSHTQNFGVGPNLITIVGTDAAGNEGICQFTVTVVDSEDPVAVCQSLSRDLSATAPGSVTVLATEMENGSSDNCFFDLVYTIKKGTNPADPFSASLDFGCLETGVNTITFRAFEDGGARFGTATCTVTISDVTPPTAVCPAQVTRILNTIGTGVVNAISVMSTSTDNCSTNLDGISRNATGPFTADIAIGCADVFNNFTAYLRYSDPSGNTNTCSTEVVVIDDTDPTITCPADMTVDTDAGVCTAAVNYPAPVTTDECSAVTVNVEMEPGFGGTFFLGTTTVELKATDASGNFSTCSFDVTVEDNEDPMFAADMAGTTPYAQIDEVVGTSTGGATTIDLCDGSFTWNHPYPTDNCVLGVSSYSLSGATIAASAPFVPGASETLLLNLGTTTFTYTVADASGNTNIHNFSVIVEDDEAPVLPTTTISRTFNAFTNGTDCSRVIPFDRRDMTGVLDCGSVTMTETIISGPDPFVLTPSAVAPFNTATGGGAVTTAQFPRGITVVEYAWIDNVGNRATITDTFDVVDNVLPVAVCRNLTKSLSSSVPGTYMLNTFDADNGSSDNCTQGTMLSIISPASVEYTCANIGTSNYTLQITDASNNTSTATCTITIVDNAVPNLTCPAAVTVGTDAGICTTNYSLAPLTAEDNCSINTTTWATSGVTTLTGTGNVVSGTFAKGLTSVVFTVTDINSNVSTCATSITVADDEAPVATNCPSNVTVNANTTTCSFILGSTPPAGWNWNGPVVFTDNCDGTSTPTQTAPTALFNLGTNLVTINSTDVAANVGTCSFVITVIDTVPPVAVCQNLTKTLSATAPGQVTVAASEWNNGSSDNCYTDLNFEAKKATGAYASSLTFDCSEVGTHTVTLRVLESGGEQSATATCTITINDITAPVLTCPTSISRDLDAAGMASLTAVSIGATATDNCASTTLNGISRNLAGPFGTALSLSCADVAAGFIAYLEFKDVSNNKSTCAISVDVNDVTLPVITCPANIAVGTDAGVCSAVVTYSLPTVTDACTTITPALINGLASGSAFNTGINTVTYRATDASGNSATCAFTVTVSDDDKPGLFANAGFTTAYTQGNQTVGTSTGSSTPNLCDGSLTWSHPFYNDNCGVTAGTYTISGATVQAATSFVQGITIANNFNLGISTVLYVVSDAAGNSSTHSFTVTVVDNESPEITATNQSFSAIVASTDCSKAITFTRPNMAGVVDCGSVTMEEKVVSGPDPAVLTGAPAFNPATGGGTITVQFPAGTTKIRYYWVDNVNNKDSVEYTFVAQDTIKPVAQCQNLTRSLSATAPASYTLTAAEANNGSTDNCPIGTTLSITSPVNTTFTCANIGTNSYTLRITDASGNTNSKTCTITILDNTAPVIACPASLSTSTDAGLCTATRSLTALSATDNCGNPVINWTASGASSFSGTGAVVSGTFNRGLTTVTYSVSDGTQTSVCTSTVTVADQQAPVAINCPANITVGANLNPGCSFKYDSNNPPAGWTWNGPISFSDNCQPNFTPAGQPSNGQQFNLGDNSISISAVDAAGNIGLCQFVLTVSDQTNPVAVCKNLSRDLSATSPGTVSIPASDFENGSSDNCFLNLTRTVKKGIDPATPFATSVTFACGEVGVQTVTYRVRESGGQLEGTATCTVTINDGTKPTVTCPPQVDIDLDDMGNAVLQAVNVDASATDNCASPVVLDGIRLFASPNPFSPEINLDCSQVTSNPIVEISFSDGNGNSRSCMRNLFVHDVTPPSFSITNATTTNECGTALPVPVFVVNDVCDGTALVPTLLSSVETAVTCQGEKITTRTYRVSDNSGNSSTAVFIVNTQDNTAPALTIPADVTLSLSNYASCNPVETYSASVTDGCTSAGTLAAKSEWFLELADNTTQSGVGLSVTPAGGFRKGDNYITYTVVDDCGNESEATMKITVVDDEGASFAGYLQPTVPPAPAASYCGASFSYDITANCTYGFAWYRPYAGPALSVPIAIDPDVTDCGTFSLTESIVTTTPIGNTQTQTPSVAFNPLQSLNAIATTNISLPVGSTVFTYTATDVEGNTSICSFTVTVNDLSNPTITCPVNEIVINSICPTQVIQDFRNTVSVNDNCPSYLTISQQHLPNPAMPSVTLESVLGVGNVVNGASFPMTFTVSDNSGNTAACTSTVRLVDNQLPLPNVSPLPDLVWDCGFAIVNAPTANTNDCGPNTGLVVYGTPGGVSAVGIESLPSNPAVVTKYRVTSPPGTYFITWTYVDNNGLSTSQLQKLVINADTNPPVAKCKTTVTEIILPGNSTPTASITPAMIDAAGGAFTVNGSHDPSNCGPYPNTSAVTLSLSQSVFTCADFMTDTIVLTATDQAGNTATCEAAIKVIDNTPPVIDNQSVPGNVTVETCANGFTPPAAQMVTATDSCGVVVAMSQTSTQTVTGPTHYNFVITRVWTATDTYGNTATASQTITVKDVVAPVFATLNPANLVFNTSTIATNCAALTTFKIAPFISDCAPDSQLTIVVNPPYFSLTDTTELLSVGSHTVTFTATDPVGNVSTATVTLVVKDATPPTASCINGVSVGLNPNGQAVVTPQLINNQSLDNCTNPVMLQIQELYSTNGDTIGAPANLLIFDCEEADNDTEYPIILWVKDQAGNFSFCETYVVVQDNAIPTITCPPAITVNCSATVDPLDLAVTGMPTVTDNCPVDSLTITYTDAPISLGYICGARTRTFMAEDISGNTATCTQSIIVNDMMPPVFSSLPPNDTISCNDPLVNAPVLVATDNCSPTDSVKVVLDETFTGPATLCGLYSFKVTRLWTATDKCGNIATHQQIVVVTDTIAPTFPGMPDTVTLNTANFPVSTSCLIPVNFNALDYFNDCAYIFESTVNSITFIPAQPNLQPDTLNISGNYAVGNTKAIFIVTDACGNVGKDSVVIRVIDNSDPIAICNNSIEIALSNNGTAVLTVADVNLSSSDNCGIASMVLDVTQFDCQDLGMNQVTLTVTDVNGNTNACVADVEVTNGPNTGFNVNTAAVAPTYYGANDGSVTLTVTGGSGNYTYNWDTGATTNGLQNIPAGSYLVTIMDSFTGCEKESEIVLAEGPQVQFVIDSVDGAQNTDIIIPVTVNHFDAIYGFSFSIHVPNLAVGTYGSPAVLDFNPAFNPADFTLSANGNIVSVLYTNSANQNLTLPDGALLFNLSFKLSGAPVGTASPVEIQSAPVQFLVLRTAIGGPTTIPGQAVNGQALISQGLIQYDIAGDINPWQNPAVQVPGVTVSLSGSIPSASMVTAATGGYLFNDIVANASTEVTANKTQLGNTNINVIDRLLVLNHIFAGVNAPSPLTSPYQRVAGDVNFDGRVNIADYSLIQQLSNLTINQLPKSWVFIPKTHVFPALVTTPYPNPTYPLMPAFPQSITHNPLIQDQLDDDLIGVRLGDVNGDAPLNIHQNGSSSRDGNTLVMQAEDRSIEQGQTVEVAFKAKAFIAQQGYQMTISFDPNLLNLQDIQTGAVPGLDVNGGFGTVYLSEGKLTASWVNLTPVTLQDGEEMFKLVFTANQSVAALSDVLKFSNELIDKISIAEGDLIGSVALEFTNAVSSTVQLEVERPVLYQNQPNPFEAETTIGFRLTSEQRCGIRVYNASGRLVKTLIANFDRGYHTVQVRKSDLGGSGVYYYELTTPTFSETKKMILID